MDAASPPLARRRRARLAALLPVLRQLLPLGLGLACLWLLAQRLQGVDMAALWAAVHEISSLQWAAALTATAASFWAVGRYDAVVHRHLGTGLPPRAAARAGALSIALAQTLGLGILTGALARWRALPGASPVLAARLSALVALSFLAGWAVVTALACLFLQTPRIGAGWAVLPLLAACALTALALLHPRLPLWRGHSLALPTLPAMGAILGLTFLDTLGAALALLVLLPGELQIGLSQLYPVFLLALGAALVSGTPGGVGPFELCLFALLPQHPEPALMVGILGFRLVYYAVPACIAVLLLLRPAPPLPRLRDLGPLTRPGPRLLAHARRSELGLARQNGGRLICARGASAITVETGQTLTALFDPAEGAIAALLPALTASARARNRLPVLYKCSARSAVQARRAGFRLWHIADEAVLDPTRFSLATPAHRQLRRKLRQADKAGLRVSRATALPVARMQEIDRQWRHRQGGARGLTMGQFCTDYLSHHQVFLAWQGDTLCGFVSFHASAHELCLDLMRTGQSAPDGTMQALIHAAIAHAAAHGRTRLSLAALPASPARASPPERAIRTAIARSAGGPGLTRFKSGFVPRYEPLYMAAPTYAGLLIAAADLAIAVRRQGAPTPPPASAHDLHDRLEIAPRRQM